MTDIILGPVPQVTTRRKAAGLLGLAGALMATGAAPAPSGAPDGADAGLLLLCAAFWAEQRLLDRWNSGDLPEASGEAAHARWWQRVEEIEETVALTASGIAAKAAVALHAWEMCDGPDPRGDGEAFARAVLREIGERAPAAVVGL